MWSIGIVSGESPFRLAAPEECCNPVLTAADIDDVPAEFVADPFMLHFAGVWRMFFEVFRGDTRRGEIGLATSLDGFAWNYDGIVLREPFHLSYPGVFEFNGGIYLIPETRKLGCVQIYTASQFPFDWSPYARLPEIGGADPSFFAFGDRIWIFICSDHFHSLRLYSASNLRGPWREHPRSPIVSNNPGIARPAGRVLVHAGRIYRFAQDCSACYGERVRAFEITELSDERYAEKEIAESPVLGPSGYGWNGGKMHHLDVHAMGASAAGPRWIACVDGHPSVTAANPRKIPGAETEQG